MRKKLMLLLCVAVTTLSACGRGSSDKLSATNRQDFAIASPGVAGEPKKGAVSRGVARAEPAAPDVGRCHGDFCSWSIGRSRTIVKADAVGTLVRLSLLGGTSNNSDSDPRQAHIHWNAHPHEIFVFCSKRLPAVIMKSDAGPAVVKASGGHPFPPYQVDVLDFRNGVPGALESSANLFVRTCYPGDDWTDPDFSRRNGLPAFDDLPDVVIDSPDDIFRAAAQEEAGTQ